MQLFGFQYIYIKAKRVKPQVSHFSHYEKNEILCLETLVISSLIIYSYLSTFLQHYSLHTVYKCSLFANYK